MLRHVLIMDHGENHATVNGRVSYLGEVPFLLLNNEPVPQDSPIDVSGYKCQVVQLNKAEALEKYGAKGALGAVEITVVQ